jgi:hypothetical protein
VYTALLPHGLFDLADVLVSFPCNIYVFAFGFQVGINAEFPGDLLDRALHLVQLDFCLVPCD